MSYKIVRFYADLKKKSKDVRKGLTLEEAQKHCSNPETSSRTARSATARKRTRLYGPWFDGYTEE